MSEEERLERIKAVNSVIKNTESSIKVLDGLISQRETNLYSGYWELVGARSDLLESLNKIRWAENRILGKNDEMIRL